MKVKGILAEWDESVTVVLSDTGKETMYLVGLQGTSLVFRLCGVDKVWEAVTKKVHKGSFKEVPDVLKELKQLSEEVEIDALILPHTAKELIARRDSIKSIGKMMCFDYVREVTFERTYRS